MQIRHCAAASTHTQALGALVRNELNKEHIVQLDLTYVGAQVDEWWMRTSISGDVLAASMPSKIRSLIINTLQPAHLQIIRSVGSDSEHVSAVVIRHVFSIADRNLGLYVHEAISEIACIADIKYPYEDHKELYPKTSDTVTAEWGKGTGIIRPHSDDLYEMQTINAMCLTVCRDTTCTPTQLWLLKDIVNILSDDELGTLALARARFRSGTNVEGRLIEVCRPVLRIDSKEGVGLRLDFRIDGVTGPRMLFDAPEPQAVFDKLRHELQNITPISTHPATGSVCVVANHKALHGRAPLRADMLYEGEASRILFRSKGIKESYL
jgi:hypothetical protein